ncbi:MAG: SPOR domain-containing protein, partial [Candidatus Aminicenantes bacterium]
MVWKKRDVLFLPGFGLIFMFILMNLGCTGQIHTVPKPEPIQQSFLPVGYTIQTGAFSVLDNAIRMTERLNKQGLEAFYFKHESGLFKVRLGNFSSFKEADLLAKTLLARKIIADYFIVLPGGPTVAIRRSDRESSFRDTLIDTAKGFISYPYTWGGESPEEGFDCSGLVLAVYRINGLKLPRTSREQY